MDAVEVGKRISEVAAGFRAERATRQLRRTLDPEDFRLIAETGYLLTVVPESKGGLWTGMASSTRMICDYLRTLAQADSSVALVSAMHPAVVSFWLAQPTAPEPYAKAWQEQQDFVTQTAIDGSFWGTVTSEPGSGGDVARSRAQAKKDGGGYALSGEKHFGSGSGICDYMVTTAVPEGESEADWFYLDFRGLPFDGSRGIKLVSEWDGHGMIATQSHAFSFTGLPAVRFAWPGNLRVVSGVAGPLVSSLFSAVIVGVVDTALELTRQSLLRKKDRLAPLEQVEWVRIENECWQVRQLYEAMLRAVEMGAKDAVTQTLHAKTAISELAESVTGRMVRVSGGSGFHRSSPVGWAFEDVRALGFLRPPWVFAYDTLLQRTIAELGAG